jgi:hypothetical protein
MTLGVMWWGSSVATLCLSSFLPLLPTLLPSFALFYLLFVSLVMLVH